MTGKNRAAVAGKASSIFLISTFMALLLFFPAGLKAGGKKSDWVEVRSPHFNVDSNSGKDAAKKVAKRLELIRETMTRVFVHTNQYKAPPLRVLAVRDKRGLKQLLPEYFKNRRQAHPAGLFLKTQMGDYIVLRTDLMEPGVFNPAFHEYAHFVMRRLLPNLPLWLSEGLADRYSDTRVENHFVQVGFPDVDDLSELLSTPLIPIQTLLTVDGSSPYYNRWDKVGIFYAESWALAHYLMFQDAAQGTHHLEDYEQQVSQGGDPVETFAKIFGSPKKLDGKIRKYVHHFGFSTLQFQITERVSSRDYSVRRLSLAEADADKAEFLLADGNWHEAQALAKESLKENPREGLANAVMSLMVLQNGSSANAAAWAEKAIQFDPTGFHGYYDTALAMQGTPLDATSSSLLERDLKQAIKLQPGLAEAKSMLSDLYLTQKKVDQALTLATDAARSDPENNEYLTDLEVILLKQGRQAEAVSIEMQMLDRAHTPKQKAMVLLIFYTGNASRS